MRRKTRYSLIIGVVLIIILGVGFGIWKVFFAPKPLKIKDLENMRITIPRSDIETGWWIEVRVTPNVSPYYLGRILDSQNIFINLFAFETQQQVWLQIYLEEGEEMVNIEAGDTIILTYDGGQTTTIYLPEMKGNDYNLYPAKDGSTYYDKALTQIAQMAPAEGKT